MTYSTFTRNHAEYSGGAISNLQDANFAVTGSTFTGNTASSGGAISNYEGNFTVTSSNFTSNTAEGNYDDEDSVGGAIKNYRGNFIITNSKFTGNTATDYGGAIENYRGTLNVAYSTFTGNTSYDGGAIDSYGTLTVTGSTFNGNTAYYGGAIENYRGTLTVNHSTFNGNSANRDGGAIYNYYGNSTVTSSTFNGNTADYGGAVYNYYSTTTIDGSTFTGNTADYNGGAINNDGNLTINSSTFTGNSAVYGGAIADHTNLTIHFSRIIGNSANRDGGAIYNYYGNSTVTSSTFNGNTADYGGAVYNYYSTTTIDGSTFTGNTADYNGGAINNDGNLTINSSTFTGNSAVYGGAIADHTNLTIHFSRIIGNSATTGSAIYTTNTADARFNWWGSNSNPSSRVSGNVTVTPWMVLTIVANPTSRLPSAKSTITADLLHDSAGVYHNPANGHVPDGLPVTFTATKGTINPSQSTLSNGSRKSTFTAKNLGTATIKATVDYQTVSTTIPIYPNLSFALSTSKGTHYYGDTIHYYITVKNSGTISANVSVYDKLPSGLKYLSSTATKGSYKLSTSTWNIGTLKPGQTAKLDIKALVNKVGDVTNKATLKDSIWKTYAIITVSFDVPKAVPIAELVKASKTIKNYYEKNKKLPTTLKVAGQTLTMAQLLDLLTTATINISKNNLKPISVKTVGKAPGPGGSYKTGTIAKNNYLKYAQNIKTFINNKKRAPNYAVTRLGNIPFSKLVYMYAKVVNFYGQNKRLPNYVVTYKI